MTCASVRLSTKSSTSVDILVVRVARGEAETLGSGCSALPDAFRGTFSQPFLWIRDNDAPDAGAPLWKTPGSGGGGPAKAWITTF